MASAARIPLILKAAAGPPKVDVAHATAVALAVVDQFIIPAYRRLAEATAAQDKAWTAFAANRASGDFASLRAAYNAASDAWANAQIFKTGPISLFLRYERFAYWPEARNVTGRMLEALLASNDANDLTPETLAHDSVAAQGLTALERLLYEGDDPAAALKANARRVAVGQGIARNLSSIARDVLTAWTEPAGVRASIAANKGWNNLFADAPEAASLLLTDLVGAFRLMHDVKLLPVMGASADVAKPNSAEGWRSARSQRDLKLNLAAAEAMTKPFAQTIPAAHRAKIDALYAAANKALDAVPAMLGQAAGDSAQRPRVEAARVAIKAVQTEVAAVLPADLGITLGFNSLDGD